MYQVYERSMIRAMNRKLSENKHSTEMISFILRDFVEIISSRR